MTDRDTQFIGFKRNLGDDLVLFGVVKGQLAFPLFLVINHRIVTLIYSNQILEDHQLSTTIL